MKKIVNLAWQGGAVFLVELAIVSMIAAIAAGVQIMAERDKRIEERFAAQGDLMNTLKGGISTYITENHQALVNGTPIPGFPTPYAPTLAQLRAKGWLPSGFRDDSILGPAYAVVVSRVPAGCVPPACDIAGLGYINGGVINPVTGRVPTASLGTSLMKMGGDGGFASPLDPANVTGVGGAVISTNPVPNTAGVLAVRTGYGSSSFAQFIRRDGSLAFTGDQSMGGKSLTNANVVSGTTATFSGAMTGGTVRSNGRLSTGEYVQIDGVASEGVGCSPNGLLGRDTVGLTLSCQSGVWNRSVKVTGDTMTGRLYTNHNDWALTAYGAGFSPNVAPQSGVGSAYVNDIYIRSVGKWASQMGGYTYFANYEGPQACQNTWSYAYCPAGTRVVSGGYRLTYFTSDMNAPDNSYADMNANAWVIYANGSGGCHVAVATCGW